MTIEIPADFQPFVREQLQLGCFLNEQQVVTEVLRLLKAERDETIEGIRAGLADVAAGHVQPLAEAFADIRREFNLLTQHEVSGCRHRRRQRICAMHICGQPSVPSHGRSMAPAI